MKNLKVLISTGCMMTFPPVKGGALSEIFNNLSLENDKENKIELFYISLFDEQAKEECSSFKSTTVFYIKRSKIISFFDKILNFIIAKIKKTPFQGFYLWKLYVLIKTKKILKKYSFDRIIFENSGFLLKSLKSNKILYKYRNNIYYHLHNDIPDNVDLNCLKHCKLITVSDYINIKISNILKQNFISYTLLNCVNEDYFSKELSEVDKNNLKNKLNIPKNNKVIIFVGRIVEYKGVSVLIDAFNELNNSEYTLLIIGSSNFGIKTNTSFEQEVENKILKNKNIVYCGFIQNNELYKFYNIADLAILPSLWQEPAGLTIVESMMCALPIITTISGGIPEYLRDFGIYVSIDENLKVNIKSNIERVFTNYSTYKDQGLSSKNFALEKYNKKTYYHNLLNILNNAFNNQ